MVFRKIITAASAVTLIAAPTIATAQAPIEPASEQVEGSELRGGFIIPLIAIVAIILGILAAIHEDEEPPHSP